MNYFKTIIIGSFFFQVLGCKSNDSGNANMYKDDYKASIIHIDKFDSVASVNSLGAIKSVVNLDTTALIGDISKVQVEEDHIYIIDERDAKTVFCYSINGRFRWKYVKRGKGYGQYLRLSDMQVKDGKVYIFDSELLKFILLDTAGHFIKEIKVSKIPNFFPDHFFVEQDSKMVLYNFDMKDYNNFPYDMVVMDSFMQENI